MLSFASSRSLKSAPWLAREHRRSHLSSWSDVQLHASSSRDKRTRHKRPKVRLSLHMSLYIWFDHRYHVWITTFMIFVGLSFFNVMVLLLLFVCSLIQAKGRYENLSVLALTKASFWLQMY